jgi:hypothetical protein
MSSIFLSHNHADKPFVRQLAHDLRAAGIRVWLDEAEMMIGDLFFQKIQQAIDEMEYLGVILSRNSVNSSWVQHEVAVAMNQEIEGKRIKVLPLVIEDCELPGFLKGKLYADFRDPKRYNEELNKILHRIHSTIDQPPINPNPPNAKKSVVFIIYVVFVIVATLLAISVLYPSVRGVYLRVDVQAGEKLTSNMLDI